MDLRLQLSESPLASEILKLLCLASSLSASEMQQKLVDIKGRYTIQAIYKELRRMQQRGLVVKQNRAYQLKMTWLLTAMQFFEQAFTLHVRESLHADILPPPGEAFSWNFTSLSRLDDFWEHALVVMLEHSTQPYVLGWLPHAWFYMTDKSRQRNFESLMKHQNRRIYRLVGGRTYLDLDSAKYCSDPIYEVSFAKSPFEGQRSLYFDVVDDYLFTIRFDAWSTRHIENFYTSIESVDMLDSAAISRFINQPIRAKVILRNDARRTRPMRNKLLRFWGIPHHQRSKKVIDSGKAA